MLAESQIRPVVQTGVAKAEQLSAAGDFATAGLLFALVQAVRVLWGELHPAPPENAPPAPNPPEPEPAPEAQ